MNNNNSLLLVETVVQSMAKNLERTLSASGKKPAGGVKLFPIPTKEAPKPGPTTKKIQVLYNTH